MNENLTVKDLVDKVSKGEVVLPDFQRSFIWGPEDVRELIVSVLGDYFIGTMLILELYKDDSPFALRLAEGVKEIDKDARFQSIVKIILDGQQRTTALFYALFEPKLPLKGRKGTYRFYLDLERALNKDWDNAVIGLNSRDKRRLGEIKNKELIIPFSLLRDSKEITKKFKNHINFEKIFDLVKDFLNRQIYIIKLPRDTDLEKIVETFERINRTGEALSIFDLLTAKLYQEGVKIRDLLEKSQSKYEILNLLKPEFVLKIIALIRGEEPKRKSILNLNANNFENDWQIAVELLNRAYERVSDIKNGYGVFDFSRWMPYSTMLVPLAAILHFMRIDKIESPKNYEKLNRWYWISVFSNRYDQAVDSRSVEDVNLMKRWLKDDSITPEFIKNIRKENIDEDIDIDVDKQGSAVYRGIINLIVLSGALDFQTGNPPQFDKKSIQDDHIFPKSKYKNNSILNRTLITTNTVKSDKIPSVYFRERIKDYGGNRLKTILQTHLISDDALDFLLKDNIEEFLSARKETILAKIKEMIS